MAPSPRDSAPACERGGPFPAERVAVALTLAGLAAAVVMGCLSDGFYQDDDVTHFRFALDGWANWGELLHWWARPGYNVPTMFVARAFWALGGGDAAVAMLGCRLFSAVQTALVAYLSYRIARRLVGPTVTAAIVPAMVWIQPLAMILAMTSLTETPAAVYLTLFVWLYLRGNRVWACAALSPAFVTRVELLALTPLVGGAVIADVLRSTAGKVGRALRTPWPWACAALLLWAPAVYVVVGELAPMPDDLRPLRMLTREYGGQYGHGSWVHIVQCWPEAAGLGVLVLAVAGAVRLGRKGWMVWSCVYGLLALHTVLFRYGLFESGGYARFLVPVCGLVGVLAAAGLTATWRAASRLIVLLVYALTPLWLFTAAAALGLAIREHPDLLRDPGLVAAKIALPALALGVSVLAAGALALLARALLRRDRRRIRTLGRCAAVALLVLNAIHIAAQVRPLRLGRTSQRYLVRRAVEHVRATEHAGAPGLTQHSLVAYLRANTRSYWGNAAALRGWLDAEPGAVFFWDSKYCVDPHDAASTRRLKEALSRLGERVFSATDRGRSVEVYAKADAKGQER